MRHPFGQFAFLAAIVVGLADWSRAIDSVEGLEAFADPGEINIGYRWMISGDDNLNASCTVRFRKQGEATWRQALGAWRFHEHISPSDDSWGIGNVAYKAENRFAGSVFWVEPGQTYEIELTLSDPDGVVGANPIVLTTTTWREMTPSPGGRKLYVVPGSGGGSGTPDDPFGGLQAAHDAAQPGDVFYLASGIYSPLTITKSGTAGAPICFVGPPDRSAVIDAGGSGTCLTLDDGSGGPQYLIIERLRLRNATDGVRVGSVKHIKFRHNIIENITRHGYKGGGDGSEFRQSIMDNWIVGDEPWVTDTIGSSEGIEVRGTSTVACYNFVERFADGMSIYPRDSTLSSPYGADNNCFDVYGNYVTRCGDDGLEVDYVVANARVWRNVITNCRMAVSNQPLFGGPCYIFRNEIFYLQDDGPGVRQGSAYKLHNGASGTVLIHNTSSKDSHAFATSMFQNSFFRNNIFMGSARCLNMYSSGTDDHEPPDYSVNDWDYDAYRAGSGQVVVDWFNQANYYSVAALASAQGVETHGMEASYSDLVQAVPPAVFGEPGVELDDFDFQLQPGAPEIDAGAVLPNINEPFVPDGQPDIGALEFGQPLPEYGPRPVGDVDRDFDLDQDDLIVARNHLHQPAAENPSCDVFIDGLLDLKDIIFARNRSVGGGASSSGPSSSESVHLELLAADGSKSVAAYAGRAVGLQVRAAITQQNLVAVAYELSASGSLTMTARSFAGPLQYLPTAAGSSDLPVVLGSFREVALDPDPLDGDGIAPAADTLIEELTVQAPPAGAVAVSLAISDAAYTSAQFLDGHRFGSLSAGTAVTISVRTLGDFDGDGDVDLDDYQGFAGAFTGPGLPTANALADLDGDGDSDLQDLAIFSQVFTGP